MKNTETVRSFTPVKRKTLLGVRRSAWLETILALVALLVIDFVFLDKTRYFAVNPHPFWFIVLLISMKYGTKEAIVSAILCSVALLLGNVPEQQVDQDYYAHTIIVLKLPLLWLVSAVIFGELRQMHIRERDDLEKSLTDSTTRENYITQSYQWVKKLKDDLELRVAGQLRSSISAYQAAKKMETLSPSEVLHGLEELVTTTLNPEQFSIYTLSKDGLNANLTYGWKETDNYTRQFATNSALFNAVVANQQVLCVVNADHERLLAGQAMLVGPIMDKVTGEVVGMLKIEKLGFTDLHLSNIETFSTISEWAGMAIVNARKYQTVKEGSITNPEHNLFTYGYFNRYKDYIASLAARVNFDVAMVTVKLSNADGFDVETRQALARALSQSVDKVLRTVDLAFDHQEHSEQYSIVLPATNSKGADIVATKIQSELANNTTKALKSANFTFTTQAIYEKRSK